jgi:hypothetical protein
MFGSFHDADREMATWLMNDELEAMWKEAFVT